MRSNELVEGKERVKSQSFPEEALSVLHEVKRSFNLKLTRPEEAQISSRYLKTHGGFLFKPSDPHAIQSQRQTNQRLSLLPLPFSPSSFLSKVTTA